MEQTIREIRRSLRGSPPPALRTGGRQRPIAVRRCPLTSADTPYPGIALRSGSSGGTVRLVQQKLNSLGERLNADGRFGAATAAAVQRFQRRNGLTADGVVGEGTWEKMF